MASALRPGTQLRSVRVEWAAITIATFACAVALGIASAFVHVRDSGARVATLTGTLVGGAVGAGLSIAVGSRSKAGLESRLRGPYAWPPSTVPEPPRRGFIRTVAVMTAIEAAFVIVFVFVVADTKIVLIYAAINLIMGLVWTYKFKRVVRIENELGVELYRSLGRFPQLPAKPTYFARTDPAA